MISALPARRLAFDECFNFRDLGGYHTVTGQRVRWRKLFRSDALHYMSLGDVQLARHGLKIATVIDLRSGDEIQKDGLGPLISGSLVCHHCPVVQQVNYGMEDEALGKPDALADQYMRMLEGGAGQVVRAIQILSTNAYPAVFHCAAGKDRTGIIAAMVLSLLGVDDETIVDDYMLSNLGVPRIVERMRESPTYSEVVRALPVDAFMVKRVSMEGLLDRVRHGYGSMRGFAEAYGLNTGTITRMRDLLLE